MATYHPPPRVIRTANQGRSWHTSLNRGTPSSVAVSTKIVNRLPWDIIQIIALVKWFGQHEVDRVLDGWNRNEPDYPSELRVNWDLHGGDEGRQWANSVARTTQGRLDKRRYGLAKGPV